MRSAIGRRLDLQLFLNNKRFLGTVHLNPTLSDARHSLPQTTRPELAQLHLNTNPNDENALSAMALSLDMRAQYASLIERQQFSSLTYVGLGTGNYIIGSLPQFGKLLLGFARVHGDKRAGIEQLKVAATRGHYLRPFAFSFIRVALTALVAGFVPIALFLQLTPPVNSRNPQMQGVPQPIASAQLAAVSGHIFRADTGAPLAKAIVIIQKVGVYPTDRQVRRTGPAGAYALEKLDPGAYQLSAYAVGFAPAAYVQGQTGTIVAPNEESVHVAAGQAISQIDLSL